MTGLLFPAVLLITVLFCVGANSAEIVIGPVLEFPGADGVTIFWETDVMTGDGAVVVKSENGGGEESLFESPAKGSKLHRVAVMGLSADTEYGYSVLGGGKVLYGGRFRTLPEGGDYRAVLISDTHVEFKEFGMLADLINERSPDFIVHVGDFVCTDYKKNEWESFFNMGRKVLDHIPIFPVVGNHDCGDKKGMHLYDTFFVEPEKGFMQPRYYKAVVCGDLYVFLDVETERSKIGQWIWFVDTLLDAAGDPEIGRIFVFSHEGVISFKGNRRGCSMLKHFLGVMRYAGVSALFSGHDHHFVTGKTYNGIDFFILGGGGGPLADFNYDNFFAKLVGTMEESYKGYHFLVMDVSDDGFTITVVNDVGDDVYRKVVMEPR